jgi:hypothetical protein
VLLLAIPSWAQHGGGGGGGGGGHAGAPSGGFSRPAMTSRPSGGVDRFSHGTIRHEDTGIVRRPVEVRREPAFAPADRREFAPHREFVAHHDVDVDFHRRHFDDFVFHRHFGFLPFGCVFLQVGGAPYYYNDGIYYQPADGGYQEVYPPVGAVVPQPPEGAVQIDAGGQVYYYAGGAFYVQQPDGTYATAPTPIGVVVPELPPGAIQVAVNGTVAYQFNGIYYEPVFVNGVTQYQTFMP